MATNLGDAKTKKLATGRLFFKQAGDNFYRDLGNMVDHKYDPKVTRKEHMKSAGGLRRTDVSLAATITPAYTFTFDEHTADLEQLKTLGIQGADMVQAGGAVVAEQLCNANSKQGRTYFTANLGLSAYVVKVAAAVKVEGVDYVIDVGSGAITILNGGGIADNSTVTIDYTGAAVTMNTFTSFKSLLLQGHIKFVEYDQFSTNPRAIHEFDGQLYVTGWGDNKDDYNQTTVDAIPLTDPIVKIRAD